MNGWDSILILPSSPTRRTPALGPPRPLSPIVFRTNLQHILMQTISDHSWPNLANLITPINKIFSRFLGWDFVVLTLGALVFPTPSEGLNAKIHPELGSIPTLSDTSNIAPRPPVTWLDPQATQTRGRWSLNLSATALTLIKIFVSVYCAKIVVLTVEFLRLVLSFSIVWVRAQWDKKLHSMAQKTEIEKVRALAESPGPGAPNM